MDFNLIKTRVVAFLWGLLVLVAGAVLTLLSSLFSGPEFAELVQTHFGQGTTATLIFLVVQQIVAHIRNLSVVQKYKENLGTSLDENGLVERPTII